MVEEVILVVPSMFLKKRLLKKPLIYYENDLEKISRSLQLIGNLVMLLSSKFHVSKLSLSKVAAIQILTVQNDKSPQNCFFTI